MNNQYPFGVNPMVVNPFMPYQQVAQPTTPNSTSNSNNSSNNSSQPTTPHQTEGPGLMQHQKEKYGAHLFTKNDDGSYTCFFQGCGKQLSANFSRHISRHEQDGDPLDPGVEIRGNYVPPKTPTIVSPTISTPLQLPMNPTHPSPMVMPPVALPIPFSLSSMSMSPMPPMMQMPLDHRAMTLASIPQMSPLPPLTPGSTGALLTRTPIKTRQSSVTNAPPAIYPSQQEMDSKGIPYQTCQHPSHNEWWGTSPILPQTEFYNRASKCKKCYIRQQQDAKHKRINQGSTNISHIVSASRSNTMEHHTREREEKPKVIQTHTNSLPLIIQQPMMNPIQLQIKQQQQQMMQQQQYMNMVASGSLITSGSLQPPIGSGLKVPFSRPKREPTISEINRLVIEKCRDIVNQLTKDSRSKWFREPVDPVKLHLPDYLDIIKHPRDLGTIGTNLATSKYMYPTQVHTDIKLVFKNAMTYNEEESEIYELAEELDKVYDDLYKKAVFESEAEAQLNAEIIKDICSICGGRPVPYKRPNQDAGDETTPVPLLLCEGSCLRAFHLHCLGLPVDTKPPWMCEECHQGRPVLHYDSQRSEYFYYYYEGVVGGEDESDSFINYQGKEDIVSDLGTLSKEEKVGLRQEEEGHRVRDMYFDPVWCMWRCKSRVVLRQRDERQRPILLSKLKSRKTDLKKVGSSKKKNLLKK